LGVRLSTRVVFSRDRHYFPLVRYTALNSDIIKFQVTKIGPYYDQAFGRDLAMKLAVRLEQRRILDGGGQAAVADVGR
jgi:hypothetical protein